MLQGCEGRKNEAVILHRGKFSGERLLNWKDATRVFTKHESCVFHKSTAAALVSRVDVGDMLSKQAATEKQQNRHTC